MHKFDLGDVLTLRKSHPCGSSDWKVIRYGSDVKIECMGCQRVVMIDRPTLMKRIKKVSKSND